MVNPDTSVIQTIGLGKSYKGVEVLKSLDLSVPQHSIFGFLGPNGAGKTITIKLLLGLIRPTTGGATVFGHDIVSDNVAIRSCVGYLPQDPHYYEHMTARETLRFAAGFFFKGPVKEIEKRIDEMLELVRLTDKANRAVRGFSGGERQRLGIAQAQINYPALLILDEPAASLDPIGRRDVLALMERLRDYTTIFYSTHILDDVQQVSDTVAILDRGELLTYGPIAELLAGTEGPVYSVTLTGNVETAYASVIEQPWVSNIKVSRSNGQAKWLVGVTEEKAAEDQLLKLLLADSQVNVAEFGRKKYELEEIFMNIVAGGENAVITG